MTTGAPKRSANGSLSPSSLSHVDRPRAPSRVSQHGVDDQQSGSPRARNSSRASARAASKSSSPQSRSPRSRAASRPRSRVAISEHVALETVGAITLPPLFRIPLPPKRPPRPPTPEWLMCHALVGFCRKCRCIHGTTTSKPPTPPPQVLYRRSISDPLLPRYLGSRARMHTSLPPIDGSSILRWKAKQEAAEAEVEQILAAASERRALIDAEVEIKRRVMAQIAYTRRSRAEC